MDSHSGQGQMRVACGRLQPLPGPRRGQLPDAELARLWGYPPIPGGGLSLQGQGRGAGPTPVCADCCQEDRTE